MSQPEDLNARLNAAIEMLIEHEAELFCDGDPALKQTLVHSMRRVVQKIRREVYGEVVSYIIPP